MQGIPMNLDDLKSEWRLEMQHLEPGVDGQLDKLKQQVGELHRGIRFGHFWIVFVFLGVSVIEVFVQFVSLEGAGWMSKLGALAWVFFTVWVFIVLRRSRQVNRSDDWTLRSRLEIEIEQTEKHKHTWSHIVAWYLAPMMSVVALSMLGGSHDKTGSYAPGPIGWVLFAVCAAAFVFVYWYVQRGIRTTLDPLLSRLKKLHAELVGSETEVGTHPASGGMSPTS
jgi:hypothetical protein